MFKNGMKSWKRTNLLLAGTMAIAVSGCESDAPSYTAYVAPKPRVMCQQDSSVVTSGFAYECPNRKQAVRTKLVCDLLAASARSLVDTNRVVGPTSGNALFVAAGIVEINAWETMRYEFGDEFMATYLKLVRGMSENVAQRNITDRVSYPISTFEGCVRDLGFKPGYH